MRILVVDDEDTQRDLLKGFLENQGYEAVAAANGREALRRFSEISFQLVLIDHRMPDMSGDEVLEKMKQIDPLVGSIMITAFGSVETAVKVMKLGADDFLEKPVDLLKLLEKIQSIDESLNVDEESADVKKAMDEGELPLNVIGNSAEMKKVLSLVRRIAPTHWTVLIRGETGTGKELIARLVHLLSPRHEKPFIEVNCAAIPENLFESELFGHEKGAFTGAGSRRRGRFELARDGSLFLDEIGELPLNLQAKILRALQENKITRVGGEKEILIDTRVIAATNRDLKHMADQGQFRKDLFYRLNVLDIEIPPLRRRKEDIPALVDYFTGRSSARPMHLDPDAMTTLMKYSFPGNVRELEHTLQRTMTLARSPVIKAGDLPAEVRSLQVEDRGSLAERLESVEREMMLSALEKNEWVQTKAARSLGISERVLRYKMAKYSIKR